MPIEDIIEDKDVDNLAVVDLSGGRRNPMEGGGGGVGGAITSPLKAFTFVVLFSSVSFVAKDCLLTGQEQACTRITRLFVRLFVCHHVENGPIHRKIVFDCPLVIISKAKLFFRPDKTRKKE